MATVESTPEMASKMYAAMDERLTESIKELLESGRHDRLAAILEDAHPADVSSAIRELPQSDQVHVFRLLAPPQAGAVLSELDDPTLLELVRSLDEHEVSRILDGMPSDHVVEVEEAYGHCPRALKFSQLWDIDAIRANQEQRPVSDRPFDS